MLKMARTPEERAALIQAFAAAPAQYDALAQGLSAELLDWRPAPGKWSAREIIVHVADTEAHVFTRLRFAIAEPGTTISPFDQDAWTSRLDYAAQELPDWLAFFRLARGLNVRLLQSLQPEQWGLTINHPERGAMTVEQLIELYEWHVRAHVEQIERNRAAFAARGDA